MSGATSGVGIPDIAALIRATESHFLRHHVEIRLGFLEHAREGGPRLEAFEIGGDVVVQNEDSGW
jgi:hypothetical protein